MIITETIILKCLKNAQNSRPEKLFLNESDLVVNFIISLKLHFKNKNTKISVLSEVYTNTDPLVKNNLKPRFDLVIVATKNKISENYIIEFKYMVFHKKCALGINLPTFNKFIPLGSLSFNFLNLKKSVEKDLNKILRFPSKKSKTKNKTFGFHVTVYNAANLDPIFKDKCFNKYSPKIYKLDSLKIDLSNKNYKRKFNQILYTIVRYYIPKKKRSNFDLDHVKQILYEYSNYDDYWYSNSDDAVSEKIFNCMKSMYETSIESNSYDTYSEPMNCAILKYDFET